ncbi:MAG TPA: molecular chaperone TorD family protein, partial [Xanthobacteraceae bacterium]
MTNATLSNPAFETQALSAAFLDWAAAVLLAPPTVDGTPHALSADDSILLDAFAEEFGCAAAVHRLRRALNGAPADGEALDLAVAWTRLFGGLPGTDTAPPYEGAYAVECGVAPDGQACRSMHELLQYHGMSVVSNCHEPADHISIELALFANRLRNSDDTGARTVHERLTRWAPAFFARCRENDPSGFYAAVAEALGAVLASPRWA